MKNSYTTLIFIVLSMFLFFGVGFSMLYSCSPGKRLKQEVVAKTEALQLKSKNGLSKLKEATIAKESIKAGVESKVVSAKEQLQRARSRLANKIDLQAENNLENTETEISKESKADKKPSPQKVPAPNVEKVSAPVSALAKTSIKAPKQNTTIKKLKPFETASNSNTDFAKIFAPQNELEGDVQNKLTRFLKGEKDSFNSKEKRGLDLFVSVGCASCHDGARVGGNKSKPLGVARPYPNSDGKERRVPSLIEVSNSAPYLHDGSTPKLKTMVDRMSVFQLGKILSRQQNDDIVSFLKALK